MKNMIRSISTMLLIIALTFSVFGCSDKKPTAETDYANDSGNVKNIIVIIGDGMGEAQLDAGELVYEKEYSFRDTLNKIYSNTNSLSTKDGKATEVTDSAASGTAIATGTLTYNKFTGKDKEGKDLETFLDVAKEAGKSTGIVTTDKLTGATPAAFSAHTLNRNLENEIIKSQIKSGVDLLVGQYYDLYDNYESSIKEKYKYFGELDEDEILKGKRNILNESKAGAMCLLEIETEAENSVTLSDAADLAIDYLAADKDGFVLVIEQAHIDKNCHNKNFEGAAKSADSLNNTVETVLEFAKGRSDTAVIITADHETCGLQVSSDKETYNGKATTVSGKEISYNFSATSHTDTPVPVFTYGFELVANLCPTYASVDKIKNNEIYLVVCDLILYS